MGRRRYRELFLFLAVLILPGVMIAVQGRRLSVQERELAKARGEEVRKRTAIDVGQEIVTRLERIRIQEMANTPATPTRRDSVTDLEEQGLAVFRGKGNCSACHSGPNFTDEQFHNTGVAWRALG